MSGRQSSAESIAGFHPVREALRHRPHEVERVLVAAGRSGPRRGEIEELCRRHGIELRQVPRQQLDRLGLVHNGFVAELEAHAEAAVVTGDPDLLVLLEDIQDPRNLGAVLRVCEGAGVGRALIRDRGSTPVTETVVRSSAGATEWLPVERITNSAVELERLKREGFWVYGAAADGLPPWQVDLRGKVALCLGGEEKGLRVRTRGLCDALVGLPMRGRVESLNVATAAAALLFEAVRQRQG